MARKGKWVLLALVAAIAGGGFAFMRSLEPMPSGPKRFFRWEHDERLGPALASLQRAGIIRTANSMRIYAWLRRQSGQVRAGTYELHAGMTAQQILDDLKGPIRQMVRIPETNWARRTANILQERNVTPASEYMALVRRPQEFKSVVSFPLPKDSLEGYLYPDTYDLPPLMGARKVITRQLQNFQKRVWIGLNKPKNLHEILVKASLVELEAGTDEDRGRIAGVIENRLGKHMKLQIDASLLYGIQKWRRLTFADYRTIDSPYNLYRFDGLPPGPICSPSLKSIRAVLHPTPSKYLYYVAMPDGHSLFAENPEQHEQNIKKRLQAIKLEEHQ
jgi:UPF0755 protein